MWITRTLTLASLFCSAKQVFYKKLFFSRIYEVLLIILLKKQNNAKVSVRDNSPSPLTRGRCQRQRGQTLPKPSLSKGGGTRPLFSPPPLLRGGWVGSYFYNFNSFIIFSITPLYFIYSAFVKRKTFIIQTFEISTSYTVIFF